MFVCSRTNTISIIKRISVKNNTRDPKYTTMKYAFVSKGRKFFVNKNAHKSFSFIILLGKSYSFLHIRSKKEKNTRSTTWTFNQSNKLLLFKIVTLNGDFECLDHETIENAETLVFDVIKNILTAIKHTSCDLVARLAQNHFEQNDSLEKRKYFKSSFKYYSVRDFYDLLPRAYYGNLDHVV